MRLSMIGFKTVPLSFGTQDYFLLESDRPGNRQMISRQEWLAKRQGRNPSPIPASAATLATARGSFEQCRWLSDGGRAVAREGCSEIAGQVGQSRIRFGIEDPY